MKIAIITIIDYMNYGNRLQNFALQEMIKSMGHDVLSLKNEKFKDLKYIKVKSKKEKIKQILQKYRCFHFLIRFKKSIKKNQQVGSGEGPSLQKNRVERFTNFTNKHILESEYILKYYDIPKGVNKRFDYFIAGSDQIWNPNHLRGNGIDFLQFAPKNKRIAYAASFGISSLPKEKLNQYCRYLKGMTYISVREISGKKIVKELVDKNADVVLDPTMMISSEKWGEMETKPEIALPLKYIVTFFLGVKSPDQINFINAYAKKRDCEVINLNDLEFPALYDLDPFEFLYLVRHSTCFMTDSFHGCVFSVLFHKQFLVFKRQDKEKDMFTRISTLLETFNMCDRIKEELKDTDEMINNHRFIEADKLLEKERRRIMDLLKGVLV